MDKRTRLVHLIYRGLGTLELLVGIGAVLGGGALIAAPGGTLLRMPLSLVEKTPFRTFLIPGIVLCVFVGGSSTAAGWLVIRRRASSPAWAIAAGAILIGWIASEMAMIGYLHWAQAAYLGCGIAIFAAGIYLRGRIAHGATTSGT
jgi:hypothetical protein